MKDTDKEIKRALALVENEVFRATSMHGPMHSYHEAYAVLLEEMDELWDEIKKRSKIEPHIRLEATQVAAMAVRLLVDLCSI